jgi:L-asparaginase
MQDVANKPGASLSFCDLFGLADAISAALGDGFAGSVVIQGTYTIEDTAYLLDLLVASGAPAVVAGAMRNPSLAGPGGPANILAAIQVAASSCARGKQPLAREAAQQQQCSIRPGIY